MSIHTAIKSTLQDAIKLNSIWKGDLSYILGEFSRMKGTKDGKNIVGEELTNEQAIRVLKKIRASEVKALEYSDTGDSELLKIIDQFLPDQATEEEVREFLDTLDFPSFKNKMQAVGLAKKYFSEHFLEVDAQLVGKVVQEDY